MNLYELIELRFKSGNSVPVERIHITRAEYEHARSTPVAAEAVAYRWLEDGKPVTSWVAYFDNPQRKAPDGWEIQYAYAAAPTKDAGKVEVGVAVTCTVCKKRKQPIGRDAPVGFESERRAENAEGVDLTQRFATPTAPVHAQAVTDVPRCPKCGYTYEDCRFHMDHHLCGEPEPAQAFCGKAMVGSGTDTYDPLCELPKGHRGMCKSASATDQHKLAAPPGELPGKTQADDFGEDDLEAAANAVGMYESDAPLTEHDERRIEHAWNVVNEKDCDRPPVGWFCTRPRGHEGPCAASKRVATSLPGKTQAGYLIAQAREWFDGTGHGDNCFVSDHYEGDPGNQCNCGRDSLERAFEAYEENAASLPGATAAADGMVKLSVAFLDGYLPEVTQNKYVIEHWERIKAALADQNTSAEGAQTP